MRYFAYGSNLHTADLARWCREHGFDPGTIRERGPAWLPDHEPVYHYLSASRDGGALSVRPRRGSATPGALFDVDPDGWRALDRKEGPKYRRVERTVLWKGEETRAITYVVQAPHIEDRLVAPRAHYAGLVERGLERLGLPTGQALDAAQRLRIDPFPRALFVYGTLMRGEPRDHLLERHARSRVSARARGRLLHLGAYPGMVEGDAAVHGELIELEDPGTAVGELDVVEDFVGYGQPGSLYRRIVIAVGTTYAWTYRYVGSSGRPIDSGDWRRR